MPPNRGPRLGERGEGSECRVRVWVRSEGAEVAGGSI